MEAILVCETLCISRDDDNDLNLRDDLKSSGNFGLIYPKDEDTRSLETSGST
jgi:hypothetical protein